MKNIYLSEKTNPVLIEYLQAGGWKIHPVTGAPEMDSHISTHPDIYMCKLGVRDSDPIFFGDSSRLRGRYPSDIPYNAACTGKYFIHNLRFTDRKLLETAEKCGFSLVNTRQGYSRCSLAVIAENSIITSDEGSAKALTAKGLDVLLIRSGYIKLPPYDYGFIGGCCGRVGDEIIFNGNLSAHPDFQLMESFILSRGLSLKFFEEYELEDTGSIICSTDPGSCPPHTGYIK